ncbi:hydantoinase [Coniochaeta sp. PMI_546]|nr:hydantoinase [Coniochaeta sp. PMI_546]
MASPSRLRVGVDVGGTNTDGVILDPTRAHETDKGIVAWHKAPTTTNPSHGISEAITTMMASAGVAAEDVASVTIGTTHFVNAVVERDARRLSPVAVLRLCGPFSKHSPPCIDWPDDMRELVLRHYALLPGGLEVDGSLIGDIDESAIRAECAAIAAKNIKSVVICGVFSPIDTVQRQEERAADIVRDAMPAGCDIVLSKEVANLGFVERENAAILNAAILSFARRTIRSFQDPVQKLGLKCPVFITQNDGTIMSGDMAARLPIRTFSSGPTNSMRGAAFLVGNDGLDEAIMVVDIGGTTSDVGLLQANGFPRQQAAYSDLAGVRMNFSCPDIKSIGLGGGSIVRRNTSAPDSRITVGPDSVGYKLTREAVVFGGDVMTTTDCTVLSGAATEIGDSSLVQGRLTEAELAECQVIIRQKLEKIIDTMKTSPADLPVLLVGGGAVIAPDTLLGASRVIKPRWAGVANAIGAAIARVSAVIDTVKSTEGTTASDLLNTICADVVERTVTAGASKETVKIVEMETLPLQYVSNKSRFIVRAAGDFDYSRVSLSESSTSLAAREDDSECDSSASMDEYEKTANLASEANGEKPVPDKGPLSVDINTYRPTVRNREWFVNETDLYWIASGCYILGTGGGGSSYPHMIRMREMLRNGAVVRVVNPDDLEENASVYTGGGMGSPSVGIEKLPADEMQGAQYELAKMVKLEGGSGPTHMISIEIGGGNGIQSMILGASTIMDLPVVDADWMGRAYPTKWQTTPVVFNERSPVWCPIAMSDGNGNVVTMTSAKSDLQAENVMRAALSQMGSHTGCAEGPVTGDETKRWAVQHTISQAWRIGRAVDRARRNNRVDSVAESIIDECGGAKSARVLWKGKIVGVQRTLRTGHIYGECIIEGGEVAGAVESNALVPTGTEKQEFVGRVKIPFKNENIGVICVPEDYTGDKDLAGSGKPTETQDDVIALVPDLISVIDAQSGEAIGTQDYRYGLLVIVIGIAASDRWTGTQRGIDIGGPKGFGFNHLKFSPLGSYVKPVSVIDEYDQ